ncbi:BatA domain-containing protein [Alteromonas oceanisediminis]|uniref:BatA domain-containing protein n=1 Tax=Alteromonas oceanisediminis TaxID=2836180 RepID=UPI001BD9A470|nr:BatA domain-containing protein [Alteromonas oceanisediminis]MBT0586633.1 BatA domain-containing protein [Alteromonas oceanisediminis]
MSDSTVLWAFALLAVPLLIHLFSRSKAQSHVFSFLALIPVEKMRQRSRIALTQKRLLALRILLLSAIILWLAGLHITTPYSAQDEIHFITPSWLANATQAQRDDLFEKADKANQHIILPDTHLVAERSSLQDTASNTWHRVGEWLRYQPGALSSGAQLTVYATDAMTDYVGQKVPLPHRVQWQLISMIPKVDPLPTSTSSAIHATVYLVEDPQPAAPAFMAALAALQPLTGLNLTIKRQRDLPENVDVFDAVIRFSREFEKSPDNRVWHVSEFDHTTRADFPLRLADALFSAAQHNIALSQLTVPHDLITSPLSPTAAQERNVALPNPMSKDLSANSATSELIAGIAFILLLMERLFSEFVTRRRASHD